jgi:hypothetical protein
MARKDTRALKPVIEYARVFTRRSGLGLEAQREAISQFCKRKRFFC